MGLDMYLSRKLYVKHWDHKDDNFEICVSKCGKPFSRVDPKKISYITEEVMYWRKANQIHRWFVNNVQGGEDDCREASVSNDDLKILRDLCKKVLDTAILEDGKLLASTSWTKETGEVKNYVDGKVIANADEVAELLPASSGFFFGGTDYNEWYLDDVRSTYECLAALDLDNYEFDYYYQSSW